MERFRILDNQELNRSATGAPVRAERSSASYEIEKAIGDQSRGRPTTQYTRWFRVCPRLLLPLPTHPPMPWYCAASRRFPVALLIFDLLIVADLLTAEPLVVDLAVGTVLAQRKQGLIDLPP